MPQNILSLKTGHAAAAPAGDLADRYRKVRNATLVLVGGLSAEDCALQSMPDASPVKWHLAHTSWFFETFVLERTIPGYRPFHPQYRVLFNSYYVSVGERHPRPERGLLSRPSFEEVLQYWEHVDLRMRNMLRNATSLEQNVQDLIELGLHHEQQHQELILTDVKHLLSRNPLRPAFRERGAWPKGGQARKLQWIECAGGQQHIGHAGVGFAFDNELPRHQVYLDAYALGSRLVTNGEYRAFMEDGGYTRPDLWLSEGWGLVQTQRWQAPLYWEKLDGSWQTFTLFGMESPEPADPVCHVSYFEADAYARWAGARLPFETEWEAAASADAADGNFVEDGAWRSLTAPRSTSGSAQQMLGDAWEWTHSAYAPYPGYRAAPGAVGEYNGKFMVNQYVLRGGSFATPRSHIRTSYRNFFPAATRWQFSGIRLARDGGGF